MTTLHLDERASDACRPRQSVIKPGYFEPRFDACARRHDELKVICPTILHALALAAEDSEDRGISFVPESDGQPDVAFSYRTIYDRAVQIAAGLRELGIRRGERVLLVMPTSVDFVTAFFGIQMAGAIPVPSYAPAVMEKTELALKRLGHIGNHAGVVLCVTDRALVPLLGGLALTIAGMRDIVTVERLRAQQDKRAFPWSASPEDPAFIQYTSGSTGSQKGVLLNHACLTHNMHAIGVEALMSRDDCFASWLPLYHDMGLIGALMTSIYWRMRLVLMTPTSFLFRPVRWLRAIDRHRATISVAPNFAYGVCVKRIRPPEREGLDLSSLRVLMNGSEPVRLRTIQEFERAYAPHGLRPNAMMPVYGLAESSLAVAFHKPETPLHVEAVDRAELSAGYAVPSQDEAAVSLVGVGQAVVGHELRVVDADGRPMPERRVGHIIARGPSVMQGYFNAPEATALVLKDGWLWTGDLGYVSGGDLFITGRAKDVLIIRGRNYYAEDIESVAERVEGVRPGGVVAFSFADEVRDTEVAVLVCETKAGTEAEQRALAERVSEVVSEHSGLTLQDVVIVAPGTIPKTSSGKRQRALTRERYLAKALVPEKTSKAKLALVLAKSAAGMVVVLPERFKRRLAAGELGRRRGVPTP